MGSSSVTLQPAIVETEPGSMLTSLNFEGGPRVDPLRLIQIYNSTEWEDFIDEWVHSLKCLFNNVMRPTGPGDKGIDVAGFTDDDELDGVWDNHQCKHYSKPLNFGDLASEIGNLWRSFCGHYRAPQACKFIAPKGASTSLSLLVANAGNLKAQVIAEPEKKISKKMTDAQQVLLEGDFGSYVSSFDFRIFSAPQPRTIIEQHEKAAYHPRRFTQQQFSDFFHLTKIQVVLGAKP